MPNGKNTEDPAYVPQRSHLRITEKEGAVGVGFYPSFQALWHLKALGVANAIETFQSDAWERVDQDAPVRIAIIDTAVAWEHPNLVGAIDLGRMRDFQSSNAGAFVVPPRSDEDRKSRRALVEKVRDAKAKVLEDMPEPAQRAIVDQILLPRPESVGPATHGTAVAGLIGARPAEVDVLKPLQAWKTTTPPALPGVDQVPLAYSGINPFCRIVPISTTAAPDPDMILAALQYARLIDARILVIAAAWEDTLRAQAGGNVFNSGGSTWREVEHELDRLGETCIILCAAGNSGTDALAYPASLSNRIAGLYSVTACRDDGTPVSYTAVPGAGFKSLSTLGGEAPRFDCKTDMIDPWAIRDFDPGRQPGSTSVPVERLISLDPPGPTGANPSPYGYTPNAGDKHLEVGSLYAEFTGTSAAVAIAAGLISLALQQKRSDQGSNKVALQAAPSASGLFDLPSAKTRFG